MAVEMLWYRIECDWCHCKVDMQGSRPVLPFGWLEAGRDGIKFMAGSQFCTANCAAHFKAADSVVDALSMEIARRIGKKGGQLTSPGEIELRSQDFAITIHHRGFLVQEAQ